MVRRGLNWTFGFNHEEAVASFRRAAEADPACAMAWWGIAYANGPHYNRSWIRYTETEIAQTLPICHDAVTTAVSLAVSRNTASVSSNIPCPAIAAPDQCPYRHASRRQRLGPGPVRAHLVTVQGSNHPGTFGVPAKRCIICRREIATVARERSPVTVASISEAARRPDSRAPCIHPRFPEACSPAK